LQFIHISYHVKVAAFVNMARSITAVLKVDKVHLCGFVVYVEVMALQNQRQQMLSIPAAEKGLGPAAASLADARVP
jgi:hypothetical protein